MKTKQQPTADQPQHTQGELTLRYAKQTKVLIGAEINGKPLFRMEDDFSYAEKEANAQRIVKAVNMHDEWVSETDNIKFYASQALKSLDNNTLSEVRGLLEGILEKSEQLLKKSEGK